MSWIQVGNFQLVKDKDRDSPSDKIKEESPLANNPPAAT